VLAGDTGPDEENHDVNDEIYTVVSAKETLLDAARAAHILGRPVPPAWSRLASQLVVPTGAAQGFQPEFAGYEGQLVKQADVTLLAYPWHYRQAPGVEERDLDYYVPRTDPAGPSMSDSVASIDSAAVGAPGCSSYVFTERSVTPYIRDDFDQFSETPSGGALTFTTGIGGFLQEFLYGYTGLRWNAGAVQLAPSLSGALGGIVVHDLSWHGRRFTMAIGPRTTTVTLNAGPTLPLETGVRLRSLRRGQTLTLVTGRPDRSPTTDVVRCGHATATTAEPGTPALAAVDGSPATPWQPVRLPATLTVTLSGGTKTVRTATLHWGRVWPPAPAPNQPPPAGPVTTLRATSYTVAVSVNGHDWQTVARVTGRTTGTTDILHFPATRARSVAVTISGSTGSSQPMLDELSVSR
jgi:hypothetical protein